MGALEERLIRKAIRKHKKIFPCLSRKEFSKCFTREDGRLLFWYDTEDRSTHLISANILRAKRVLRPHRASRRKPTAVKQGR